MYRALRLMILVPRVPLDELTKTRDCETFLSRSKALSLLFSRFSEQLDCLSPLLRASPAFVIRARACINLFFPQYTAASIYTVTRSLEGRGLFEIRALGSRFLGSALFLLYLLCYYRVSPLTDESSVVTEMRLAGDVNV